MSDTERALLYDMSGRLCMEMPASPPAPRIRIAWEWSTGMDYRPTDGRSRIEFAPPPQVRVFRRREPGKPGTTIYTEVRDGE